MLYLHQVNALRHDTKWEWNGKFHLFVKVGNMSFTRELPKSTYISP